MDAQLKPNRIGLVGLGLMGTAISLRLQHAGYSVIGYDIHPDRCAEFVKSGGRITELVQDVFQQAVVVILSLPTSQIVHEVIEQVKNELENKHVIIDTSTGDPVDTRTLSQKLINQNVSYLDATISGSSVQVATGDAVMLVGAYNEDWETWQDLLKQICPTLFHLGTPGSGAQMKLVTNLVLGLNRAALAEGLAFAQHSGLDLELTLKLLKSTMAYSRIMDTKGHKMISQDFTPQAKLAQHLKDVNLMLNNSEHLQLPLTSKHQELLLKATQAGWGELDNSALFRVYLELLK